MKTVWTNVLAMFSARDPDLTPDERREVLNAQARDRYRQRPDVRARADASSRRWYYERGGRATTVDGQRYRKFGIPRGTFAAAMARQGGVCAMPGCVKPATDMDHDHATGLPRGALCRGCNYGLGVYERLRERAALYLATHTSKET